MSEVNVGDRVSWDIPGFGSGTGRIIGRDNVWELVHSDEVIATHERKPPETGTWDEHRLLRIGCDQLTKIKEE